MRTTNITYENRAFRKLEKIKKKFNRPWERIIYTAMLHLEEDGDKKDKKVQKV